MVRGGWPGARPLFERRANGMLGACRQEFADLIDDLRVVQFVGQIERLAQVLVCLVRLLELQDATKL